MSTRNAQRLAKLVVSARNEKGLSQRAAASKMGIDASYLALIEQAKRPSPAPKVLRAIARVLALDLEDLYALAVYPDKERLPEVRRYFRTKHGLSETAIDELEQVFEAVKARDARKRGRDGR